MSDLVDRLYKASEDESQESWSLRLHCRNAADEIERLQEIIDRIVVIARKASEE